MPTTPVATALSMTPLHPLPLSLALLSAGSQADLEDAIEALRASVAGRPEGNAEALVRVHPIEPGADLHRFALLSEGKADMAEALKPGSSRPARSVVEPIDRPVALMFPGLGDHYVNMGRDLYQFVPVFREQIDLCAELLEPELGVDLRSIVYPASGTSGAPASNGEALVKPPQGSHKQDIDLRKMLRRSREEPSEAEARLNQTRLAQPALFIVEYALAKLWESFGLRPEAMIGYSLGEYVAACLAGVLSLEDSLTLVARRAQMIEELPPGAMLAVTLSEEQTAPLLGEHLSLSAVNGPEFCVVAGPREAVYALEKRLLESGTATQRVQSSHAFHSRMMDPIAPRVRRLVGSYTLRPPEIPYISNVTGAMITAGEATDPAYWATHLCRPVRFADGVRELLRRPERILLEAGPGQTLSSLAMAQPRGAAAAQRTIVPSVRHTYDPQADVAVLLKAVSQLWLAGARLRVDCFQPLSLRVERGAASATPGKAEASEAVEPEAHASPAPRTDVEKELAAIWQKLLRVERVGREDSFFALGGNSLIATRLLFRILKSFRVNLPLRHVYEAPSLDSMAKVIEAMAAGNPGEASPLESVPQARGAGAGEARERRGVLRYRLPNGLEIAHQSEAETRHFYQDIFEHRSYVKHDIRVPKGATVFDVGANIGLFTLFVHTEARDARIYSFEPAPPLFDILRRNVAEHRVSAELFNVGLSDRERDAPFTFYPNSSGMSSFHADEAEERHVLRSIIENQQQLGMPDMDQVMERSEELLNVRLEARTFTGKLRRLSDVIREVDVGRIDLLKIDVQKSELDVLLGIDEPDWPKLQQIVLEVHDIEGRLNSIAALLERRGFMVASEQDPLYLGTNIHNIYAVRKER